MQHGSALLAVFIAMPVLTSPLEAAHFQRCVHVLLTAAYARQRQRTGLVMHAQSWRLLGYRFVVIGWADANILLEGCKHHHNQQQYSHMSHVGSVMSALLKVGGC